MTGIEGGGHEPPVVHEVLSAAGTGIDLHLTAGEDTAAGWWLIAVHGWDWGSILSMPPPQDGHEWTPVVVASAGDDLPHLRVWARQVQSPGAVRVTFASSDDVDNHCYLWVISGADLGISAWDALATDTAAAAQAAPSVPATANSRLLCVWYGSGADGDYTLPSEMTRRGQVYSTYSRSAAGAQLLPAAGPSGERVATRPVATRWAAVSVALAPATEQRFTVQRTSPLPHAAGTAVSLAHPAIVAL